MSDAESLYGFVGRAFLTEAALDRTPRLIRKNNVTADPETSSRLSVDLLDQEVVSRSSKMAVVYTAIAAFENSARDLVSRTLQEKKGHDWWTSSVSEKIRKKAQGRQGDEEKVRWHTQRGLEPINYTDFGDLGAVIVQNWDAFSTLLLDQAWVTHIFQTLERSRNLIMHSGELENEDIARIGVVIRDWVKQVPV